jgi:hypothetical protein
MTSPSQTNELYVYYNIDPACVACVALYILHRYTSLTIRQKFCTFQFHICFILQESAEIYLLVIFGLECVLKIIAFGFMLHPGSYLRSGWNMLDFVVVVTG